MFAAGDDSAFSRYGIVDADRSLERSGTEFARMSSHQPRHWINTVAHKAGLSAFLITVWMQRANPSHTLAYLHDATDIGTIVRGKIEDGSLAGSFADAIRALPSKQRELALDVVHGAHVLEGLTYCVKSEAPLGCSRHRLCPGCEDFHVDVSEPLTRIRLRNERDVLGACLRVLEAAETRSERIVSRQREALLDALRGLDHLLDGNPNAS